MNVALIPARGGSKRIPRKNVRLFAGKPMIAHALGAIRASGLFDRVVVSTDSDDIAGVARDHGAETPFLRPPELSDDLTPTAPVLLHALDWFEKNGQQFENLCCVYATAAFVRSEDLRQGLDILLQHRVSSVFSVTSYQFPIFRALRIDVAGRLSMYWPEHEMTRSQDLPAAYHDAAQFYWLHVEDFRRNKCIYTSDAMPVVIPRYRAQDVDTPEDWDMAERMFLAMETYERQKGGRCL
jgi:pseudaminic acid cytidylyltransferase